MDLTVTKKLFHAIVVIGMASTASCSNGTTDPGQDAAADTGSSKDTGGGQDVVVADTGGGTDAGGDAVTGWLGC